MHLSQPTPCHRAPRGTDLRPGAAVAEGAPAGRMRGLGRVVRGLKVAARTGRGLGLVVLGACGSGSGTAPGGGGGTAVAPSITAQPASASVVAGATATFSVTASGTAPLSYQWRRGGTNISGATSASYTLQNTTSSDNGAQFSVVVTNSAGSVTSSNATLTVTTGTSLFPATIQLSSLNGTNGFRIPGAAAGDLSGYSVSDAGDVNGDGIDDFIVGAVYVDASGTNSGAAYVVFGKTGGFGTNLNLSTLNGTTGFRISGEERGDFAGLSVSAAGDVNNDGYDDLLVGATGVSTNGKGGANWNITGAAYVVFGKASGFTANLNLSTLNGTNGFQLFGIVEGEGAGYSVSSAGDINGDGFDDVIVGAWGADTNGTNSGAAYVVFGKAR